MREKRAFSIIRHRNLRGLDLVCINANFSIKKCHFEKKDEDRSRPHRRQSDSEEKPKNEKRKI